MLGKVGKLKKVWLPIESSWSDTNVIGAYSTLDSAMESVYEYLENRYPDTVWVWDGYKKILEHESEDYLVVGFYEYEVDCDEWRKF